MIQNIFSNSSGAFYRWAQLVAAVSALLVVTLFLRHFLHNGAASFRQEFERQSFLELGRGDTFLIARKLAAVAKGGQVNCVTARKQGILFFEEKRGNCGPGLFRVVERVRENNQAIEIAFTLRLPDPLFRGFALFCLLQAVLALAAMLAERRAVRLEHQHDLELASLARQVAHDIRSPLAVIAHAPAAPVASLALARLEELVRRLLGEPGTVGGAATAARLVRETIEEKNIEFAGRARFECVVEDDSMPVPGDLFLWRRTLSNLLNNSVEAAGKEPASVEVKISRTDGRGSIEIRDHGRGIPANMLPRVGERGFSLGKAGGRGLGVSAAIRFLDSLGGTLVLRSREGKGTSVTLEFPLYRPEAILIDDDFQLALVWQKAAERGGVDFRHFSRPEDFLANLGSASRFAAVYLDFENPLSRKDPEKFSRELKKRGFHNVFLSTGHPRERFLRWKWLSGVVGKEPPWLG